jgi:hypothetical protein
VRVLPDQSRWKKVDLGLGRRRCQFFRKLLQRISHRTPSIESQARLIGRDQADLLLRLVPRKWRLAISDCVLFGPVLPSTGMVAQVTVAVKLAWRLAA